MTPWRKQKVIDMACLLPLVALVFLAAEVYTDWLLPVVGFSLGIAYFLGDTFGKKFYGDVP